jgi:hypothetical protein
MASPHFLARIRRIEWLTLLLFAAVLTAMWLPKCRRSAPAPAVAPAEKLSAAPAVASGNASPENRLTPLP